MATRLNVEAMEQDLIAAGVDTSGTSSLDAEEWYNRIIHLYDVFILLPAYQFQAETAAIVCDLHRFRNQKWITKRDYYS